MTTNFSKAFLLMTAAAMAAGCSYSAPLPSYMYPPTQAVYYVPPGQSAELPLPPQQNYQVPPQQQAPRAIDPKEMESPTKYTAQQLDQIVGPIALYPDPLLTAVLTASTVPQQVTDLDQFLKTNASPTDEQVGAQPWDASVKGLAKFPSVVSMMAGKMEWTQALGWAMVNQQGDVMDSVQRLRAQARANQSLQSNPQQQVVVENQIIQIVPAQPDVIYVPYYDPWAVYGLGFGLGFGFGYIWYGDGCHTNNYWNNHCDWNTHTVRSGMTWGNWNRTAATATTAWTPSAGTSVKAPTGAFTAPRTLDEFHRTARLSRVSTPAQVGGPSRSVFSGPSPVSAPPRLSPIAIPSSPSVVGDHHRDRSSVLGTTPPAFSPTMAPAASPTLNAPAFSSPTFATPTQNNFSGPSSPTFSTPNASPAAGNPPQRMVIPVAPTPIQSSPSRSFDFHHDSPSYSSSPSPAVSGGGSSPAPARVSSPAPAPSPSPAPAPARAASPAPSSNGGGGHRGGR